MSIVYIQTNSLDQLTQVLVCVSGMIADRFGQHKLMVFLMMILTMVFHVTLLYVPARPRALALSLTCGPGGHHLDWPASCTCQHQLNNTDLHLTVEVSS